LYDNATDFYNGKALVLEDGIAYVIDESYKKIKKIGLAESIQNYGELFMVTNAGDMFEQMICLD